MHTFYLIMPLFTSFSFILFSWVLLTFLLRPKKPVSIAGITFQGIIPSKIPGLIAKLKAEAINAFPSFEEIENKITNPKNTEKILPIADAHLDNFLRNKLSEKIPVLGMFIGDRTINNLKTVFLEELKELFPSAIKSFAGELKNDFNPEDFITKAMGPDLENKIESMLKQSIYKNIFPFYILSGIFGFITGLLIDGIIILTA